ncbi:MAG: hypothetical protein ACI8V2_000648 [Candidatus Latescibacterota bacterium]|jgi:hypothetical protein
MMSYTLTIRESDGYPRRSFPCATTLYLPPNTYRKNDTFRLLDTEGKELPCQIDALKNHSDGSVEMAEITFAPFLSPYQTANYTLELGGETATAQVRNPITVDSQADVTSVKQGVMSYTVRHNTFNLVDDVTFRDKAFVKPGLSTPTLILKNGHTLNPTGTAKVTPETQGPWAGRLRVEGHYPEDYTFVTHLTFVSSKSWFLVDHKIVSGNLNQIEAIQFASHYDLTSGPLSSATGARIRHDGTATSWAVITDGTHTVDIAILDAWTPTGAVRCEADADGQFRVIYPFTNRPCRMYVHVLHGPPDDIVNTPAPAMAAELTVVSNSNSNVAAS